MSYREVRKSDRNGAKETTDAGSICDRRFSVFLRSSSRAIVRTRTISSRSVEYFSSILNIVSTMFTFLHAHMYDISSNYYRINLHSKHSELTANITIVVTLPYTDLTVLVMICASGFHASPTVALSKTTSHHHVYIQVGSIRVN